MSQKPDKDPKSLKDFKYTKLHELFEMTETHQLFDIWGSYVEIDGWVVIDLNPETGSIHEYEDYDLSAESFLDELNTMEMLPSMRLPIPSTSTGSDFGSDVAPSDRGGDGDRTSLRISRGRTEQPYEKHNEGDDGRIAALKKGEEVWTEIAKNLLAALKADDQQDANTKDPHELKDESESPEVEDSPRREGSESPETDVDFRQSSSDGTNIEWVLRSENIALKASDALSMVEANGTESVTGEIGDLSYENDQTVIGSRTVTNEESKEEIFNTPISVSMEYAKETSKNEGESEESRINNQRRKHRRNIELAACATAVAVAAIWMMERLDMA